MTISNRDLAVAEREILESQQIREKISNEEFKIWKKTVPLLYDTIQTHVLDFPLSIQWLPGYSVSDNKNNITVKLLLGSNSLQNNEYLKLASLDLPSTLASDFSSFLPRAQSIPIPLSNATDDIGNFKILSTWKHDGQINKLKLSPDASKVLTFDNQGIVHLYRLDSNDYVDFKYHKQDGNCLEWVSNDQFLSGAKDGQIALWEISKPSTPIQLFKSHSATINGISYNLKGGSIFGSVADDHFTHFSDIRASTGSNPVIQYENTHIQNTIAFHPQVETLFATGGKDNVVSLFDLRKPGIPMRNLFGHNGSIQGVIWDSGNTPSTLVSWGLDKRTIIWDLNNLEEDFTYPNEYQELSRRKNVNKVDPCLHFIHGGHAGRINDVDVHPSVKGLYVSIGADNLLEIWKPKSLLIEEEGNSDDSKDSDSNKELNLKATKGTSDVE